MKKVVIALSIVLMLFAFASCDNSTPGTKAEFKVDASVAKVPGVTVTLEDMTKKAFSLEGGEIVRVVSLSLDHTANLTV